MPVCARHVSPLRHVLQNNHRSIHSFHYLLQGLEAEAEKGCPLISWSSAAALQGADCLTSQSLSFSILKMGQPRWLPVLNTFIELILTERLTKTLFSGIFTGGVYRT